MGVVRTIHAMNKLTLTSIVLSVCLIQMIAGCNPPNQGISATTPPTNQALQDLRGAAAIFDASGNRKQWKDLIAAAENADVIILGETHDDDHGHAIQQAYFADAIERWPDTALSMEMLDRREQAIVDDYLADIVDKETFFDAIAPGNARKLTRSYLDGKTDRAKFEQRMFSLGWPKWEKNYQPMIDRAKEQGATVIASNTPWLRYTTLANNKGLTALQKLTPAQRSLVEMPPLLPAGDYRKRFFDLMSSFGDDAEDDAHGGGISEDMILGMYRAQCVMDATMAASIVDHLSTSGGRVIHLVGQFHSDFNGGLVEQLRFLKPNINICNISLQPTAANSLREEDGDRGDYVVFTRIDP